MFPNSADLAFSDRTTDRRTDELDFSRSGSGPQRGNKTRTKPRKSLEEEAREFAARLRHDYAEEIARSPREFKKQVLRFIRAELPSRRGRPPDPQIEAALALLRQGNTVRQVLRAQVRGFNRLDTYGRYLAEKALRQAIARRRGGAEAVRATILRVTTDAAS